MRLGLLRLFQSNFYVSFLLSFLLLGTVGGLLLYPSSDVTIVQSMFTSFSAITSTGLSPFNFQQSSFLFKIIVLILIQLGSMPLWSLVPLIVRRRFLTHNFSELVFPEEFIQQVYRRNSSLSDLQSLDKDVSLDMSEEEAQLNASIPLYQYSTEYWATIKLCKVIIIYIASCYLICMSLLSLRFLFSPYARSIASEVGGWVWFSFFHTINGFNNAGFALFNSSLEPFNDDPFILFPLTFVMFAGLAGYPIFLRSIVRILADRTRFSPVYKFLLSHGREVYTHLFSQVETNWLSFWAFLLYSLEFVSLLFDFKALPHSGLLTLLNVYFGSITVKSTGFSSFDLNLLSPSSLLITLLLMIVGQIPFIATLRGSAREFQKKKKKKLNDPKSLTAAFLRILKSQQDTAWLRDCFWVSISSFLVLVSFGNFKDNRIFTAIFEVASAYGNVGLSLGWEGVEGSFVAFIPPFGQIVLCLTCVAGRLRGLPTSYDRSITTRTFEGVADDVLRLLPVETLAKMGVDNNQSSLKDFKIDPRIEMLLTRGCLPEDSITFIVTHHTYPPRRIMNVRELMDLRRAQEPVSDDDT
ncbi:hypothetical protein GEMRC1_002414 [Eukaryota sp. GEM-RC1]